MSVESDGEPGCRACSWCQDQEQDDSCHSSFGAKCTTQFYRCSTRRQACRNTWGQVLRGERAEEGEKLGEAGRQRNCWAAMHTTLLRSIGPASGCVLARFALSCAVRGPLLSFSAAPLVRPSPSGALAGSSFSQRPSHLPSGVLAETAELEKTPRLEGRFLSRGCGLQIAL